MPVSFTNNSFWIGTSVFKVCLYMVVATTIVTFIRFWVQTIFVNGFPVLRLLLAFGFLGGAFLNLTCILGLGTLILFPVNLA